MSYKHLTIEDRSKIEVLYHEGYTASQIAEAIGRHRSTIYRELIQDIQTKLELTWFPEQIVGRCYHKRLSFKTIYNWIYQGIIDVLLSCLRQKGKRRKPQETRGKFNNG